MLLQTGMGNVHNSRIGDVRQSDEMCLCEKKFTYEAAFFQI